MKNIGILIVSMIILISCNKKKTNVPQTYIGTWKAQTGQMITTEYRNHTLTIPEEGKGKYTSIGELKILDESSSGYVTIENGILLLGSREFEIKQPPIEGEDGIMEMQLSTLKFKKS